MNIYESALVEPLRIFYEKLVRFLPDIFTSIFILVVGIVLGFLLKNILSKLFKAVGLDKVSERSGTLELLKREGVTEPFSALLSRVIGWIVVIVFAGISMSALQIPAVENLFERLLLYLPNIFIALLIIFVGYLLGNFFGRAALIASVNAGVKFSSLIGKSVKYLILMLSATMALEQLGIGKETIIIAFAIIFGGIVLALAIAFGLGGRDIAKDYLEKKVKCEEKKDEINHL